MNDPDSNTLPSGAEPPPKPRPFAGGTTLPSQTNDDSRPTNPTGIVPNPTSPTPADPFQTAAGGIPPQEPVAWPEEQAKGPPQELPGYEILGTLGQGGMGVVYKARHLRMKRLVAVKVIRHDRGISQEAIQRFNKEIEAAAQLTHPNVVMAFDADEVDGTLYFVMEYIEGIDLSKLVQQKGPLPVAEACDYIRQAALGLQHAHDRGLVHRDIKPSNLLLTNAEGLVKILDLGLARLQEPMSQQPASQLTGSGTVVGTPDFMSPEQARDSRSVDIRSDLYSLGCTLYFLLTKGVPFPEGTYTEKLLKHCMDEPRPITQLRSDLPEPVVAIVHRLMAKKPDERFQTPLELADALEPFGLPPRNMSRTRMGFSTADQPWPGAGSGIVPPRKSPGALMATEFNVPSPTTPDSTRSPALLTEEPTEKLPDTLHRAPAPPRRFALVGILLVLLLGGAAAAFFFLAHTQPRDTTAEVVVRPTEPPTVRTLPETKPTQPDTGKAIPSKIEPKKIDPTPPPPIVKPITGVLAHFEKPQKPKTLRVALASSGEWAVTASDGRVYLWKVPVSRPDDRPMAKLTTQGLYAATAVAVLADGSRVLMGRPADDPMVKEGKVPPVLPFVTFWDAKNPGAEEQLLAGHKKDEEITSVALSARGKLAVSGSRDRTVRLWDLDNRKLRALLGEHTDHVSCVALSPDGRFALSGDWSGKVYLWDAEDLKKPKVFSRHKGSVNCVTFSPDGRQALSAGDDKVICLYDLEKREQVRTFEGHTDAIRCLAFCPDNVHFLSGSDDNSLRLWDTHTREPLQSYVDHNVPVISVAASADGKYAVFICSDYTIRRLELPEKVP
jgi:serine/threonine protein kinase